MLLRKKLSRMSGRWLMPLGMIAVSLGIIVSRIGKPHLGISDFSEGFLLGLGIVLLLASIALTSGRHARLDE